MSINRNLIAKSDENWECVELLKGRLTNKHNAAASRMYYSVFLLVKSAMVRNNENPDLPPVAKISMDAATGVHSLARQYLDNLDPDLGRRYRKFISLREQADYDPSVVNKKQFDEAYSFWAPKRRYFRDNLIQLERLLP